MAPKRRLSRAAYLPDGDASWSARYRALPFPERWKDSLLELCNAPRSPNAEPLRTVPTWRMDGVLQSLAPDLIVRSRAGYDPEHPQDYWIYAPADLQHPLPDPVMTRLITAWLRDLCPDDPERRDLRHLRRSVTEELTSDLPEWEEVTVDLLDCETTQGGTAAPVPRQYQLAADALARRVMTLEPYDTGADLLRFRATPRGPRDQGAELLSQPLPYSKDRRTWWFSVRINITLHTAPFSPLPRLHVHLGIRRWATVPRANGQLYLPYSRATSVLLRPEIPWLPGAPPSDRYALAHLVRDRTEGTAIWRETGPAGILRDLTFARSFPDPAELLAEPEKWIGQGPGVRAGVVHHTHMGAHKVGTGLMPQQRSELIDWLEQALPEELARAPELVRAASGHTPSNWPRSSRPEDQEASQAQSRRAAIAVTEREFAFRTIAHDDRPVLEARLLWQTAEMRDAAIAGLVAELGLEGDGGVPRANSAGADVTESSDENSADTAFDSAVPGDPVVLRWQTPELEVRLRCLRLTEGLADPLDVPLNASPRRRALAEAIARRRESLTAFLKADSSSQDSPTLALVELGGRKDFPQRISDPKFALRLGAADGGVLTQFVEVPKPKETPRQRAHRAASSWRDGQRQLGVRILPEHTVGDRLPDDLRYAALWMVKRRKDGPTRLPLYEPVAVLMTPIARGSGQAVVRGWDKESKTWIPYPRLLLRLTEIAEIPETVPEDPADTASASNDKQATPSRSDSTGTVGAEDNPSKPRRVSSRMWKKNMEDQRRYTEEFLQHMLRSLRGRPTMLLTASQNSRQHWPWLQDGCTVADLMKPGHAPASRIKPDLRLVRVRTPQGRETPQWWKPNEPQGKSGFASGLWREADLDVHGVGQLSRVFYSTTGKPSQFSTSAVEADKLTHRPLTKGENVGALTIDTDKPAWNPGLMEIAVLGCHPKGSAPDESGDEPEAFALAVHQLRQAPDYGSALALPLPLHMAAKAQEYVLPTLADDREDDSAAEKDAETEVAELGSELLEAPALDQGPLSGPDEQLFLF